VVNRAQSNPDLHEAVVNRADLPVDLLNEMYFVVEVRLRERIMAENAKVDQSVIDEAMNKSRDKIGVSMGVLPSDYDQISKDVSKLLAGGHMTPSLLARYMRDPNPTWFLVALAQLADIDYATAKHLSDKREIDALAIACKAADLDKSLFLTYVMIMLGASNNAMGKAKEYGQLYMDLPRETALRTIRFWRLRRAEGFAA
jgi:uncharacterized protein (DUF2336 family)